MKHSNLANSVKFIRKLRKAANFVYEMHLEQEKATNDSENAKNFNQFFQSVFNPMADGSRSDGSDIVAGHWFYDTNPCIGSIGSEQEDSFLKPVADHRFKTSGNEKKIHCSRLCCRLPVSQ